MPHTLTITDAEARELAVGEYMIRHGDRDWLCCSRGSDGGMHLRETRARRADAETWLAHKVAQLAARIVLGDASVYRTASGRLELA
jgi:hypothetical protein